MGKISEQDRQVRRAQAWRINTRRCKSNDLPYSTMDRKKFGGAKRDRTADLLHAMQALSQLSYSPILGPARPVPGRPSELFVRSVGGFILLLFEDGKPKKTKGQVFIV
jgi:hypothetical protein